MCSAVAGNIVGRPTGAVDPEGCYFVCADTAAGHTADAGFREGETETETVVAPGTVVALAGLVAVVLFDFFGLHERPAPVESGGVAALGMPAAAAAVPHAVAACGLGYACESGG